MHFILIKNIRIMKKFGLFFISAFMMVLEGLRDRYIGSLFRVDEPVPDDSLNANGCQAVADAFMRVYCIDLKKAGALNSAYLESIIIQ